MRTKHGALLDAELLAEVYLELIGGRQPGLTLAVTASEVVETTVERTFRAPRPHAAAASELARHEDFVETEVKDPIWRR